MDRRRNNRTDESTNSNLCITDSLKSLIISTYGNSMEWLTFTDEEMRSASPETILQRMLSTKSAISTGSSLAQENQRAREDANLQVYTSIGKGQCGTVYALKGTTIVIKIPNSAGKEDELFREFQMHKLIENAFSTIASVRQDHGVQVPGLKVWVGPQSAHFWTTAATHFPQDVHVPTYGLMSQRIYPLPLPVREAIVDALCPKAIRDVKVDFLKKPENKDCLVRLYLGRRNDSRKMEARNIRLRNFPFHVDEMERLGLNTASYTRTMAQALAFLHWQAGVDANDVEFALGSSPLITGKPSEQDVLSATKDTATDMYFTDFQHRTISIWLLDFNQCKTFTHDEAGVKKLVEGFWFNDPYYPRPNATNNNDKELWVIFARHYLEVSSELTTTPGPRKFIDAVVEKGKSRGSLF